MFLCFDTFIMFLSLKPPLLLFLLVAFIEKFEELFFLYYFRKQYFLIIRVKLIVHIERLRWFWFCLKQLGCYSLILSLDQRFFSFSKRIFSNFCYLMKDLFCLLKVALMFQIIVILWLRKALT